MDIPRHRNYKTQPCRHFMRGFCQRGGDCDFAHGTHEVRILNLPSQFASITVQGNEPYGTCPPEMSPELSKMFMRKFAISSEEYVIISHTDVAITTATGST